MVILVIFSSDFFQLGLTVWRFTTAHSVAGILLNEVLVNDSCQLPGRYNA